MIKKVFIIDWQHLAWDEDKWKEKREGFAQEKESIF